MRSRLSFKGTRKAWQKFGQGFRVPLREGAPKGSYFGSAVAEPSHSGALLMIVIDPDMT